MTKQEAQDTIFGTLEEVQGNINPEVAKRGNPHIWAALALIGYSYCQIIGDMRDAEEAKDFWPFGEFEPNEDVKANLLKACQMLVLEAEKH